MRIHEISLNNFRVFKEFKLKLDPQLTVLIGRNRAGKSTVLEGLAVALGAWLSGFSAISEDHPIPRSAPRLTSMRTSSGIPAEEASPVLAVAQLHRAPALRRNHQHDPRTQEVLPRLHLHLDRPARSSQRQHPCAPLQGGRQANERVHPLRE